MTKPESAPTEAAAKAATDLVSMFATMLTLALFPVSLATQAGGLLLLWRWFIVPATGYQPLGFWQALGVLTVGAIFLPGRHSHPDERELTPLESLKRMTARLAAVLLVLSIGAVAHYFAA